MPRLRRSSYYVTKDQALVNRGLDPRSLYPRCDFCAKGKQDPGTTQLGRWWGHAGCVTHPENRSLASAKLPAVDYSDVRSRRYPNRMVLAKLLQIQAWSREKMARFREEITGERVQEG